MTGTRVKPFKPAKNPEKCRISPKLRTAITAMICEGLTRLEAAELAGITEHTLYCALRKPHVIRFKNDVLRALRESLAERSLVRVETLADAAKSENVKLEANKTLMQLDDRFTPAAKVNHVHSGSVTFTPGYIIDLHDDKPAHLISDQVLEGEVIKQDQGDN